MAQADIAVDVSRRDMICARGRRAGLRMHDARRCYFAIASLAGLLRSMRLLLGGRAGRLVGMLSGLDACAPPAFGVPGVTGGLAVDAESAGAAVWACALVSNPMPRMAVAKAKATTVPGSILIARDFMGFSGSATLFHQSRQSASILFCDTGARGRFVFLRTVRKRSVGQTTLKSPTDRA